jgi:hypothetical protein
MGDENALTKELELCSQEQIAAAVRAAESLAFVGLRSLRWPMADFGHVKPRDSSKERVGWVSGRRQTVVLADVSSNRETRQQMLSAAQLPPGPKDEDRREGGQARLRFRNAEKAILVIIRRFHLVRSQPPLQDYHARACIHSVRDVPLLWCLGFCPATSRTLL